MIVRTVYVAVTCARAFCRDAVEAALAESFSLRGPLIEFRSRLDCIASLGAGGLERGDCEILGNAARGGTGRIRCTRRRVGPARAARGDGIRTWREDCP